MFEAYDISEHLLSWPIVTLPYRNIRVSAERKFEKKKRK